MRVDELAVALRKREALLARCLFAQFHDVDPRDIEEPALPSALDRAIAASVVELLAERTGRSAPSWTARVAPLPNEFVLVTVRLPEKLARLRQETPRALRVRNLVAPESFLCAV